MRDTRPWSQQGWRSVRSDPPPEREVVEVANNGVTTLLLDRNLWWFPDHSMYVYYTPEWWRPAPQTGSRPQEGDPNGK